MVIVYSLIAASAALLGSFMVLRFHEWSERNSLGIISFSAGVMLTIAFTHLIPEAFEANTKTMFFVLIGFLLMFFLQFVVLFHPSHDDDECERHSIMGMASFIGLSLHSFIDGLIIAIGFEANTGIGLMTTLAVLLHKIPDGITISGILLHSGASKSKVLNFSLITALFTPLGTILGLFLFKNLSQPALGALLGITGGTFIFLAASDLIPETHKSKNKLVPYMLFVGVILVLSIEFFTHG